MRKWFCDQCGAEIPPAGTLCIHLELMWPNGETHDLHFESGACMRQKVEAMISARKTTTPVSPPVAKTTAKTAKKKPTRSRKTGDA